MKGVTVKKTDNGAQVMWAVPTGGFGHAADEQPLPYVRYKGKSLTPRYGGDESLIGAGYESLPLPSFYLIGGWPLSQKIFNLFRRRVNIYWRNLFATLCRTDNRFLFAQQLKYLAMDNGFHGFCPLLEHYRFIEIFGNVVVVRDEVHFKTDLHISKFILVHYPTLDGHVMRPDAEFNTDKIYVKQGSSSTGHFELGVYDLDLDFIVAGECIRARYSLEVVDVV